MEKYCKKCGSLYPIEFFDIKNYKKGGRCIAHRYAKCKGCRQTIKDKRKQVDRWRKKVRDTLKRHAHKTGLSWKEYAKKYGFGLNEWVHKLKHTYENGCPSCGMAFSEMGHGLADITLDQKDPNAEPYCVNFEWICATCNRQKQNSNFNEWGRIQVGWRRWREIHNSEFEDIGPLFNPLINRIYGTNS